MIASPVSILVSDTSCKQEHPGGAKIILKYAGRDATSAYEPIHPPDALEKNLPQSKHLGPISEDAAQSVARAQETRKKTKDEIRVSQALLERPPLGRILNLADMEVNQSHSFDIQLSFSRLPGCRQKGSLTQGTGILFLCRGRPH
jgi:L-lactate dehydrogenase (cytochrome)